MIKLMKKQTNLSEFFLISFDRDFFVVQNYTTIIDVCQFVKEKLEIPIE